MKAAMKRARLWLVYLAVFSWSLVFAASAGATPNSLSPTNGARISSSAQYFSWLENNDYGPLDHWYLEISTDPLTDSWGYFWYLPVYASPNLSVSSVDLNAIVRALPPGTYYWHVLGYYGPYGSLGTAWSLPVRSFTVYNSVASAPIVNVAPGSLYFTAMQGGANPPSQSLYVSNKGTGTLYFDSAKGAGTWLNNPALGTNTGEIQELIISVNVAGVSQGIHSEGTIGVKESSKTWPTAVVIPITLEVFAPDYAAPTGSISINNGAASAGTTATLNLSAADGFGSGVDKMRFKDDGGAWSNWFSYETTAPWSFTGTGGVKKVWAQFKDKVGNVSAAVFDTVSVVSPTLAAPAISTNVSKTKVFRVSWLGGGSGVAGYNVQSKIGSTGAWTNWKASTTAAYGDFTGVPGNTYYFRARGRDGAGNLGLWSAEKKTIVPFDQNSKIVKKVGFAGTINKASSNYYLGTARFSTTAGDVITYSFTGNHFALVGTKGPKFSRAVVTIDGVKKTIDARSATKKLRQVLMEKVLTLKKHTVKIKNLGTAGRTRFEIDGNAVGK